MSTLAPSAGGLRTRLRWQLADSLAFAGRNLAHVRQVPEKLMDVTLQPLMFVLLFAFVFGGVIHVPSGNYREYLIGGIVVQTLGFGVMGPGVSIATDLTEGIVDRFRSLPASRAAYLYGHLLAELAAAMLGVAVMMLTGLLIGWGIHADVPHALAGVALIVLIATTALWVGTLLGVVVRVPDAVQGFVFVLIFPLTFVSNVFVPASGLPDGLRQVAEWNPFSAFAAALRTLFGNPTALPDNAPWPLTHPVLASVLWCAGLLALVVPLTIDRYRARTTG
ncbi:MAG TPA: ABC transporter permease [Conexibacter sp.]|nr:ABC transporter permease [Conexibacter sp.]